MNFISEVLSNNIKLECENDNNELFEKNFKQELIKYLIENLNIESINIIYLIAHLFKNGLNQY
jgi:hypothetical protein